jgi:hypothetical protein
VPTHLRQGDDREDLTLTPAKKFIDATARELYQSLDKEACPTERQPHGVKVEGAYLENRDRCCLTCAIDAYNRRTQWTARNDSSRLDLGLYREGKTEWMDNRSRQARPKDGIDSGLNE